MFFTKLPTSTPNQKKIRKGLDFGFRRAMIRKTGRESDLEKNRESRELFSESCVYISAARLLAGTSTKGIGLSNV